MGASLVFVGCQGADVESLAGPYRDRGWGVDVVAPVSETLALLEEARPLATIFCLDGSDSSPLVSFAQSVIEDTNLSRPLLVFIGGDPAIVEQARVAVPFGVFVRPEELGWVLKHLDAKE